MKADAQQFFLALVPAKNLCDSCFLPGPVFVIFESPCHTGRRRCFPFSPLAMPGTKEHRQRVETRISEISGSRSLTWQDVVSQDYHLWNREHIVTDTASRSVEQRPARSPCSKEQFHRLTLRAV